MYFGLVRFDYESCLRNDRLTESIAVSNYNFNNANTPPTAYSNIKTIKRLITIYSLVFSLIRFYDEKYEVSIIIINVGIFSSFGNIFRHFV